MSEDPVFIGVDLAGGIEWSVVTKIRKDGIIEIIDSYQNIDPNHPSVIDHVTKGETND